MVRLYQGRNTLDLAIYCNGLTWLEVSAVCLGVSSVDEVLSGCERNHLCVCVFFFCVGWHQGFMFLGFTTEMNYIINARDL